MFLCGFYPAKYHTIGTGQNCSPGVCHTTFYSLPLCFKLCNFPNHHKLYKHYDTRYAHSTYNAYFSIIVYGIHTITIKYPNKYSYYQRNKIIAYIFFKQYLPKFLVCYAHPIQLVNDMFFFFQFRFYFVKYTYIGGHQKQYINKKTRTA